MRYRKVSHLYSLLNSSKSKRIESPLFESKEISVDIKRDDLIHPILSGNKWRKLKHLLLYIESLDAIAIQALGGRYSNFLHSLSYVCHLLGWPLEIFVLRYPNQPETPMMSDAKAWGAKLTLVDKQTYRQLRERPFEYAKNVVWLPEGGFEALATKGAAESIFELSHDYDYLITASATGTTIAGYCAAVAKYQLPTRILAVAVLKNDDEIMNNVIRLAGHADNCQVIKGYECGGFAKHNAELERFIELATAEFSIPLEPVYSGKSFWALYDMIEKNRFPKGSRILYIHCGGMQGARDSCR